MEKQSEIKMKKIPLAKPDITDLERKAVMGVLKTPNLSLGPKLKEFEKRVADFVGVKYAVAVNSGTSALHLIIRALGIGKGDEVITTPFSFIASANCVLFEGAKPVFVDIKSDTFNIDPELVEGSITPKTKAILAVDIFGQAADWDILEKIAKKHNLFLIEDSAEALGSEFASTGSVQVWKKCGSFGEAGVFAFYPNKIITTGEGGMIVTNNKKLADLSQSLRNQGRPPTTFEPKVVGGRGDGSNWLDHQRLGYNYRLSEINCALGIAQLKRIKQILAKRNRVANIYSKRLKNFLELEIPFIEPKRKVNWFVYVIKLNKKYSREKRDKVLENLRKKGIGCSNYFTPIHLQPFYQKMFGYKKGDFPITEFVSQRTIALPFYNNLTGREIDYIVKTLKEILYDL